MKKKPGPLDLLAQIMAQMAVQEAAAPKPSPPVENKTIWIPGGK